MNKKVTVHQNALSSGWVVEMAAYPGEPAHRQEWFVHSIHGTYASAQATARRLRKGE